MSSLSADPTERFLAFLPDPDQVRLWLANLGVRDVERGYRDLRDLGARGVTRCCSRGSRTDSKPRSRVAPTPGWR